MVQDLPPGFRFHPTDEELIVYYLRNQYTSNSCPSSIIPEVDIYKSDPWDLPGIVKLTYIYICVCVCVCVCEKRTLRVTLKLVIMHVTKWL